MSIAIKNGQVVVKDGRLAENCDCCGGWYCYCAAPPCDLYDLLGLKESHAMEVTIEGVQDATAWTTGFGSATRKPAVALNKTFTCRKRAYSPLYFDTTMYNFLYVNSGASWLDRPLGGVPAYDNFVVREMRRESILLGRTVISASIIVPGTYSSITPAQRLTAIKSLDSCAVSIGDEIVFDADAGDFGTAFSGIDLPPNNATWQEVYGGTALLGYSLAPLYGYNLRHAKFRVKIIEGGGLEPADSRAWWFATPYGGGGESNPPPQTISVSVSAASNIGYLSQFAGSYTLELGKYASGTAVDGTVIYGAQHGSFYATAATRAESGIHRTIFVDARPRLVFINGAPHISWSVALNGSPKVSGWYGQDGFGTTDPVPWGENTSGTLSGSGSLSQYIGGGDFSVTIEL
jgi:hypothetical protein